MLLAVALWLPVQAIAVPSLALQCPDADTGPARADLDATQLHHGPDAGDAPTVHDTQDSTHQHGSAGHFCCHHFSAIAAAFGIDGAAPPGVEFAIVVAHDYRFFPERAKRPLTPSSETRAIAAAALHRGDRVG